MREALEKLIEKWRHDANIRFLGTPAGAGAKMAIEDCIKDLEKILSSKQTMTEEAHGS